MFIVLSLVCLKRSPKWVALFIFLLVFLKFILYISIVEITFKARNKAFVEANGGDVFKFLTDFHLVTML